MIHIWIYFQRPLLTQKNYNGWDLRMSIQGMGRGGRKEEKGGTFDGAIDSWAVYPKSKSTQVDR